MRTPGGRNGRFAAVDVLILALRCNWTVKNMAQFLSPLGVHLTPGELEVLAEIRVSKEDLSVLEYVGGSDEISPAHLVGIAKGRGVSVQSLVDSLKKFEPLGIRVPRVDPARLDELDPSELRLLSRDVDEQWGWLGTRVPVAHLVRIADKLNISMGDAWHRLEKLSWIGILLPTTDAETLDTLAREERMVRLVAQCFAHADIVAGDIAEAIMTVGSRDRAIRLGTALGATIHDSLQGAFEALASDFMVSREIPTIIRAYEAVSGGDQGTRRRRGRALARFHLWKPTDAELDATIASLEPVIDYITRQAEP